MSWLEDVEDSVGYPPAVATNGCFVEDGTTINLSSLPSPSLVLKTRYLERRRSGVMHYFRGRRRCDVIALIDARPKPTMLFIEAKSGDDGNLTYSEDALEQLRFSLQIMRDAINECNLNLPFARLSDCTSFTACVMESLRGGRGADSRRQAFATDFYRQNRVSLTYVPADQDIWQFIQRNRP